MQLGVVGVVIPRANVDAILLLPAVVLLEVVNYYHSLDFAANTSEVLHVVRLTPQMSHLVHGRLDSVLSVEPVRHGARHVQFVKHLVGVLKQQTSYQIQT